MIGQADIKLTGLIGSNPLGALAAFGLLRVCHEISALAFASLSWQLEDDWVAVLTLPTGQGETSLVSQLAEYLRARRLEVFTWSDDIRERPESYKRRLREQAQKARYCERLEADYYAAYGSEMKADGSKGLVKPTAFHMTSGQQKFLKSVREVAESLRNGSEDAIREALFGPWHYQDQYHSLGWDPITERMYALRYRAPTSEQPVCVRAAVWFAVEALPLFPTVVARGRLDTAAFAKQDGVARFVWPIWSKPIGLDTLRTLLLTSELFGRLDQWESLERRGVAAIYESVRSEFGQGYAILRPSALVWSAG
ncbi:MAG: hypothetical protein AB1555_10065 [Nitrospirota bacterium]